MKPPSNPPKGGSPIVAVQFYLRPIIVVHGLFMEFCVNLNMQIILNF